MWICPCHIRIKSEGFFKKPWGGARQVACATAHTDGAPRRPSPNRRMTVAAPDHVQAWWECARLELVDGDVESARRRLGTILEITRDPGLRRRVTDLLTSLPAA